MQHVILIALDTDTRWRQ